MKTIQAFVVLTALSTARLFAAEESTTNAPSQTATSADATNTTAPVLLPNGEPGLRLNFRGASLDLVLNYLSEAAGFIIVLDTKVSGKIDAWSNQPLTKDEAVDLLNSVLNKNGYAAIRHGRTLNIVNKSTASSLLKG